MILLQNVRSDVKSCYSKQRRTHKKKPSLKDWFSNGGDDRILFLMYFMCFKCFFRAYFVLSCIVFYIISDKISDSAKNEKIQSYFIILWYNEFANIVLRSNFKAWLIIILFWLANFPAVQGFFYKKTPDRGVLHFRKRFTNYKYRSLSFQNHIPEPLQR